MNWNVAKAVIHESVTAFDCLKAAVPDHEEFVFTLHLAFKMYEYLYSEAHKILRLHHSDFGNSGCHHVHPWYIVFSTCQRLYSLPACQFRGSKAYVDEHELDTSSLVHTDDGKIINFLIRLSICSGNNFGRAASQMPFTILLLPDF